jgi:hypothetical protein
MSLIIVDERLPEEVCLLLEKEGSLLRFSSADIVYPSISGHTDIFFCKGPETLILAPCVEKQYGSILKNCGTAYITGMKDPGMQYPDSVRYNALITEELFIRNASYTDAAVEKAGMVSQISINVKQGYTACNTIALANGRYITSDRGIAKALELHFEHVLYTDPSPIRLDGMPHGFIGGCCGVKGNRIFFSGSLDCMNEAEAIRNFLREAGLQIIEAGMEPLTDCGGILFL